MSKEFTSNNFYVANAFVTATRVFGDNHVFTTLWKRKPGDTPVHARVVGFKVFRCFSYGDTIDKPFKTVIFCS